MFLLTYTSAHLEQHFTILSLQFVCMGRIIFSLASLRDCEEPWIWIVELELRMIFISVWSIDVRGDIAKMNMSIYHSLRSERCIDWVVFLVKPNPSLHHLTHHIIPFNLTLIPPILRHAKYTHGFTLIHHTHTHSPSHNRTDTGVRIHTCLHSHTHVHTHIHSHH